MASYRTRLARFYAFYCPEKLNRVDAALFAYEGREEEMFMLLREKYGECTTAGSPVCRSDDYRGHCYVSHREKRLAAEPNPDIRIEALETWMRQEEEEERREGFIERKERERNEIDAEESKVVQRPGRSRSANVFSILPEEVGEERQRDEVCSSGASAVINSSTNQAASSSSLLEPAVAATICTTTTQLSSSFTTGRSRRCSGVPPELHQAAAESVNRRGIYEDQSSVVSLCPDSLPSLMVTSTEEDEMKVNSSYEKVKKEEERDQKREGEEKNHSATYSSFSPLLPALSPTLFSSFSYRGRIFRILLRDRPDAIVDMNESLDQFYLKQLQEQKKKQEVHVERALNEDTQKSLTCSHSPIFDFTMVSQAQVGEDTAVPHHHHQKILSSSSHSFSSLSKKESERLFLSKLISKHGEEPPFLEHFCRLCNFYLQYSPEKIWLAADILYAFFQKEEELYEMLERSYGPDFSFSFSSSSSIHLVSDTSSLVGSRELNERKVRSASTLSTSSNVGTVMLSHGDTINSNHHANRGGSKAGEGSMISDGISTQQATAATTTKTPLFDLLPTFLSEIEQRLSSSSSLAEGCSSSSSPTASSIYQDLAKARLNAFFDVYEPNARNLLVQQELQTLVQLVHTSSQQQQKKKKQTQDEGSDTASIRRLRRSLSPNPQAAVTPSAPGTASTRQFRSVSTCGAVGGDRSSSGEKGLNDPSNNNKKSETTTTTTTIPSSSSEKRTCEISEGGLSTWWIEACIQSRPSLCSFLFFSTSRRQCMQNDEDGENECNSSDHLFYERKEKSFHRDPALGVSSPPRDRSRSQGMSGSYNMYSNSSPSSVDRCEEMKAANSCADMKSQAKELFSVSFSSNKDSNEKKKLLLEKEKEERRRHTLTAIQLLLRQLCTWCWAISITMKKLEEQYGVEKAKFRRTDDAKSSFCLFSPTGKKTSAAPTKEEGKGIAKGASTSINSHNNIISEQQQQDHVLELLNTPETEFAGKISKQLVSSHLLPYCRASNCVTRDNNSNGAVDDTSLIPAEPVVQLLRRFFILYDPRYLGTEWRVLAKVGGLVFATPEIAPTVTPTSSSSEGTSTTLVPLNICHKLFQRIVKRYGVLPSAELINSRLHEAAVFFQIRSNFFCRRVEVCKSIFEIVGACAVVIKATPTPMKTSNRSHSNNNNNVNTATLCPQENAASISITCSRVHHNVETPSSSVYQMTEGIFSEAMLWWSSSRTDSLSEQQEVVADVLITSYGGTGCLVSTAPTTAGFSSSSFSAEQADVDVGDSYGLGTDRVGEENTTTACTRLSTSNNKSRTLSPSSPSQSPPKHNNNNNNQIRNTTVFDYCTVLFQREGGERRNTKHVDTVSVPRTPAATGGKRIEKDDEKEEEKEMELRRQAIRSFYQNASHSQFGSTLTSSANAMSVGNNNPSQQFVGAYCYMLYYLALAGKKERKKEKMEAATKKDPIRLSPEQMLLSSVSEGMNFSASHTHSHFFTRLAERPQTTIGRREGHLSSLPNQVFSHSKEEDENRDVILEKENRKASTQKSTTTTTITREEKEIEWSKTNTATTICSSKEKDLTHWMLTHAFSSMLLPVAPTTSPYASSFLSFTESVKFYTDLVEGAYTNHIPPLPKPLEQIDVQAFFLIQKIVFCVLIPEILDRLTTLHTYFSHRKALEEECMHVYQRYLEVLSLETNLRQACIDLEELERYRLWQRYRHQCSSLLFKKESADYASFLQQQQQQQQQKSHHTNQKKQTPAAVTTTRIRVSSLEKEHQQQRPSLKNQQFSTGPPPTGSPREHQQHISPPSLSSPRYHNDNKPTTATLATKTEKEKAFCEPLAVSPYPTPRNILYASMQTEKRKEEEKKKRSFSSPGGSILHASSSLEHNNSNNNKERKKVEEKMKKGETEADREEVSLRENEQRKVISKFVQRTIRNTNNNSDFNMRYSNNNTTESQLPVALYVRDTEQEWKRFVSGLNFPMTFTGTMQNPTTSTRTSKVFSSSSFRCHSTPPEAATMTTRPTASISDDRTDTKKKIIHTEGTRDDANDEKSSPRFSRNAHSPATSSSSWPPPLSKGNCRVAAVTHSNSDVYINDKEKNKKKVDSADKLRKKSFLQKEEEEEEEGRDQKEGSHRCFRQAHNQKEQRHTATGGRSPPLSSSRVTNNNNNNNNNNSYSVSNRHSWSNAQPRTDVNTRTTPTCSRIRGARGYKKEETERRQQATASDTIEVKSTSTSLPATGTTTTSDKKSLCLSGNENENENKHHENKRKRSNRILSGVNTAVGARRRGFFSTLYST